MDIYINKRWQVPIALAFWAIWFAVMFGLFALFIYYIPKGVWWLYSWVIPCNWNFGTWLISMIILFVLRIYKFETATKAVQSTNVTYKRTINIRFK